MTTDTATAADALVMLFRALPEDALTDAFERISELHAAQKATDTSEAARMLRSLRRVAEELGHDPSLDEWSPISTSKPSTRPPQSSPMPCGARTGPGWGSEDYGFAQLLDGVAPDLRHPPAAEPRLDAAGRGDGCQVERFAGEAPAAVERVQPREPLDVLSSGDEVSPARLLPADSRSGSGSACGAGSAPRRCPPSAASRGCFAGRRGAERQLGDTRAHRLIRAGQEAVVGHPVGQRSVVLLQCLQRGELVAVARQLLGEM